MPTVKEKKKKKLKLNGEFCLTKLNKPKLL